MRYLIVNKAGKVLNMRSKYPSSLNKLPAKRKARIILRNELSHAKMLSWGLGQKDLTYYAYGTRGYKIGRAFHRLATIYGFGAQHAA